MAEQTRRCEHRYAGQACTVRAVYRVSRAQRKSDAQDSCRRHLAATVDALGEGDGSTIHVDHIRESSHD